MGEDVLTPQEVAELGGLRSRWRARRLVAQQKGPAGGKLVGKLQREQINLAMIRAKTHSDDHRYVLAQPDVIYAIRAELQAPPDLYQHPAGPLPAALAAPPPGSPSWWPSHIVPAPGMAVWDAPDPSREPTVMLAGGIQLQLVEQAGAWARVLASNGWQGWVDSRLLVALQ